MPYLIDSDILIDVSRGKESARDYLDSLPTGWGISHISALELIVGARDKSDLAQLDLFLGAYVILPLREAIGFRAYELVKSYAKSHGLHVFDALIAATAIEEGLILVTKNRKYFATIDRLMLEVPPC